MHVMSIRIVQLKHQLNYLVLLKHELNYLVLLKHQLNYFVLLKHQLNYLVVFSRTKKNGREFSRINGVLVEEIVI